MSTGLSLYSMLETVEAVCMAGHSITGIAVRRPDGDYSTGYRTGACRRCPDALSSNCPPIGESMWRHAR
jgi:hypothetical protein